MYIMTKISSNGLEKESIGYTIHKISSYGHQRSNLCIQYKIRSNGLEKSQLGTQYKNQVIWS